MERRGLSTNVTQDAADWYERQLRSTQNIDAKIRKDEKSWTTDNN